MSITKRPSNDRVWCIVFLALLIIVCVDCGNVWPHGNKGLKRNNFDTVFGSFVHLISFHFVECAVLWAKLFLIALLPLNICS